MPRIAHCVGCNITFPKMHLLRQHRWSNGHECAGPATKPKFDRRLSPAMKELVFWSQRTEIEDKRWLKQLRNFDRVDMRARQCAAWREKNA